MSATALSESTVAKAVEYLENRRVHLTGENTAIVHGKTGDWRVMADEDGLWCSCPAHRRCSHVISAMLMFRLREMQREDGDAESR